MMNRPLWGSGTPPSCYRLVRPACASDWTSSKKLLQEKQIACQLLGRVGSSLRSGAHGPHDAAGAIS
eukprot:6606804-Prorocentrum_lima.AAC.1